MESLEIWKTRAPNRESERNHGSFGYQFERMLDLDTKDHSVWLTRTNPISLVVCSSEARLKPNDLTPADTTRHPLPATP